MSGHHHQEYHHHPQHQHEEENVFTFSSDNNGFDQRLNQQEQIRRDNNNKLSGLVAGQEDPSATAYETTGMLSEMFNFGPGTAQEILDYRRAMVGLGSEWYGSSAARQLARDSMGDRHPQQQHNDPPPPHHQISSMNEDSAAAMQLFLTNPPLRSPSPPPPPTASSSTLHMLLPSPPNQLQPPSGFHPGNIGVHPSAAAAPSNQNFWGNPPELSGIIHEGQGLSLSLSSSLQQLEAAKQVQEFRELGTGDHSPHNLFFNQTQPGVGASSSTSNSSPRHFIKHLAGSPQQPILHNLQGVGAFGSAPGPDPGPNITIQHQVHPGFGSASTGVVNALRSSRYAKPAQELLEEFCSAGRGQIKKSKLTRQNSSNPNPSSSAEGGGNDGSSSTKDPNPNPNPNPNPALPLSPADRIEHQRRKVKLLSMLDEVDRRYNHYCEQMQMVVNSFDMVMGFGAAIPYTALAQKAMSRHFRCLKDAIQAQLKQSCELLGEKDPTTSSGLTRGETPRLKMLEQSLRQQRVFHQMGMMDQEAWRPQRGLPERSVNVLRAWLFEHFLHPYVSNWFINARVRLWKPMIEEMYQQEAKEAELEEEEERDYEEDRSDRNQTSTSTSNTTSNNNNNLIITTATTTQQQETQNPMPSSSSSATHNNYNAATATATATASPSVHKRSAETMTRPGPPHHDTDPSSLLPIHRRYHHHQPPPSALTPPHQAFFQATADSQFADSVGPPTMIRFGPTNASGDVSLTLGLRHAGNNNAPDKTAAFSLRDFGSC
ncbi:hypothetical protein Cgig2_007308 [Carnegiea gigantea]|uniref:POX domain-containing protein n=1 Tax=Carnegiea gigantea TaxID=171969 RepID=A0A9Q1KZB3_9CARY|nr:hypothetical protein Cgig2_007308 [Carnegiea gigantea]